MCRIIILTAILALTLTLNYPVYKQCESTWAKEQLGTSNETICSQGSLITSIAMGLKAIGKNYNPSTLNTWLKSNRGYIGSSLFVWNSINSLGLVFQGHVGVSQIRASFDVGKVVVVQIQSTGDWAIMTGYKDFSINVNDAKKGSSKYDITELVDGNSGQYIVPPTHLASA